MCKKIESQLLLDGFTTVGRQLRLPLAEFQTRGKGGTSPPPARLRYERDNVP